eukprot:431203-Hanusia_phi.AAC.2
MTVRQAPASLESQLSIAFESFRTSPIVPELPAPDFNGVRSPGYSRVARTVTRSRLSAEPSVRSVTRAPRAPESGGESERV